MTVIEAFITNLIEIKTTTETISNDTIGDDSIDASLYGELIIINY